MQKTSQQNSERGNIYQNNQIADSEQDIILLLNPTDLRIIDANLSAVKVYQMPKEKLLELTVAYISKFPEKEIRLIGEVFSSDIRKEYETIHLAEDGREIGLGVIVSVFDNLDEKLILYTAKEISFPDPLKKSDDNTNLFRLLYEYNPLISFTIDSDGKILSLNKSAINELHYFENELLGNHISRIYHPEDEQLINFQINQCLGNPNKPFTWELRLLSKTGSILWVRVSAIAIKISEEKQEVIVVCDNITHQKDTEKTLIEYAKSLQRMIDASPLGVLVYNLDEQNNLRLISTNASTEKILGINSDDYLYKRIEEIFPSLPQQTVINDFRKIAKEGGNLLFQKIKYIDRNISGTFEFSAIQLSENTVAVFFTDITEREKALELLKESETKYRTLFDSSNDAILLLKNEYFIEANQKALELFGCNLSELIYKTPFDLSPEYQEDGILSRDSALEKIKNAMNGTPQFFEWKHKKLNGSEFDADVSLFVTEIKGEKFIQAIVRDITEKKKTQKQIAMFANAFRNISESIIIGDTQDNIIFVNEAFSKTYGYSPTEILGKNVSIIRSSKNPLSIVQEILPSTLKGGWKGELINVKKSGEEIIISLSTSPIYDDTGKLIALCGIVEDITERKQTLQRLAESEERFRSLVNSIAEAVVIVDWNGKILFANQSAAKLVDLENPEKGVGKSITEFLHPADIDKAIRLISFDNKFSQMRTEKYRILTANKKIKWVESISEKVRFQDQLVLLSTLRDITERIKTEEMLHLLTNALHSAANGVLITDNIGRIVWVNEAVLKLTGYDEKDLIGKSTSVFKSGLLPDKFYTNLWNTITAGKVWKGELINKRKDGSLYDEEMTITPILDDEQNITNFIAVKQDITERKRNERELREAKVKAEEMNKLKTSFLANMSHELRTPLVGILGFAELLRDNIADTEMSQMASRIYSSGKRLLETLNSLLDLSRIEANKMELKSDFINVCRVVRENIMQFEALAKSKNLYLRAEIHDKELISFLDDRILHQILNNLVNNALKFTKAGGVTIFVEKESLDDKNYVSIKVKDTGIGIPEESLPKIFEEFRQVSEGLDRKFDGTGLGLTLTKKFVELLGGTISVESKLNEGSVFIVRFPLEEKKADDKSEHYESEMNIESSEILQFKEALNILLVENDEASIEVTKLFLKDKFNVDISLNGEHALNLASLKKYDLILMDINLGKGISGIEVTQRIKQMSGYEKVPIIAMTAYAMVGDREEFFKAGCSHYLSKPFRKEQLLNVINDALSH